MNFSSNKIRAFSFFRDMLLCVSLPTFGLLSYLSVTAGFQDLKKNTFVSRNNSEAKENLKSAMKGIPRNFPPNNRLTKV